VSDAEAGFTAAQRWDERHIWRAGLLARTLWLLGFVAVFAAVPMLADRYMYDHWYHKDIYDLDWARLLREMGWLPTWAIASLALWLSQRKLDAALAKRHAQLLIFAPALAGIVSEVLKLVVRRERPAINDGDYGFRAWDDRTFSTVGLGMPSGHTMVAFAAATALARIYPGARWVWYSLAVGCAATRVLDHAHFLSDVTVGALLGWSIGWGVWIALRRRASA
jgi:membrane-associated phospholipid phosphatase